MLIVGIVLMLAGAGSIIYGSSLNNDINAQLESLISTGNSKPGNIWLYIGIAVVVIGIAVTVLGAIKKKNK